MMFIFITGGFIDSQCEQSSGGSGDAEWHGSDIDFIDDTSKYKDHHHLKKLCI